MPYAPKKPCSGRMDDGRGCPYLGDDCPAHGKTVRRKAYDQARGPRHSDFAPWKATSAVVKARDPICTWGSLERDGVPAGSCPAPTHAAAHIVPHAEGGSDDPENCRGLCASHHSAETSRFESWNRPR